jgi:N-acetylglutamate synthase-like GNAT family acetyltransferase
LIREATIDDLNSICEFLRPYHDESVYSGFTYDDLQSRIYMCEMITGENSRVIIVEHGFITGLAVLSFRKSFFKELEADISMFYIGKEYRGTGVSRVLVDACTNLAKSLGAHIIRADNVSGLDKKNDAYWTNLFSKFGYQKLGTTVVRFLNG